MLPDFKMIVHSFPDPTDIKIYPISDVHLGAEECMEEEFISFIDEVKKDPNAYLVLGGDLISNGLKNSLTNVYAEKYRPHVQKQMMAEILKPVANRILAAVSGNHERRSAKESDSFVTLEILSKINRESVYRENMAFVKIQLGGGWQETAGKKRPTYILGITHGAGGGGWISSSVLRGEKAGLMIDGVDAFIFGHHHKPFLAQPGKLTVDSHNNIVSVKPFKVIGMTSWLGYAEYAMQKMMMPTTHCIQTLTLCGNHKEMVVTM